MQGKREVKLNNHEWRILSLVDGNRTVREVTVESGYDEFTAHKSLCSLKLSGLLEEVEPGKEVGALTGDYETITSIYTDIFQVIHEDLRT